MIPLKSEKDLELMRVSGSILAKILQELRKSIKAGVTTAHIDKVAESLIEREKVKAAFKGYRGYPATICASVNNEIVHGIPGDRVLLEGDVFSVDIGISYEGFFSDAAITVAIGTISTRDKKLIEVTRQALAAGIKQAQVNNHLSDISNAVQNHVERYGFSVVRQFVGHGIGSQLHEEPEVANFGMANKGPLLKHGMVLAIEPMVNTGAWESKILENGWTAVTADGLNSAHFEHTVAITNNGPEILTR